ncbi:MAG TPA: HAD-IIA family hydrolase [Stellaceae bacterium]|nr:HAD-IIA family hydrolase [Stellaceae bacterium]
MIGGLRGFMFDVDGTLVLGDRSGHGYEVLPGAVDVLERLNRDGIPFVLLTNGSATPPAVQAAKLRDVGLPVADDRMLTPSSVVADYFRRRGIRRVLVLGTRGVGHALTELGIEVRHPGDFGAGEAEAVYVGWHPDCTMPDIEAAANAIWQGAGFYVASSVPFFATRGGRSIGYSHAIVAAIRSLTKTPAKILGKPSREAFRFVARRLGVPARAIGVVGDDPALEIGMARRAGATGFGVATGLTDRAAWLAQPPARQAHHVLDAVGDLLALATAEEAA